MPLTSLALFAALTIPLLVDQSSSAIDPPKLLLSAQRLKRLKRDRERQTVRWSNFDRRVQTVVDSPERGFELALYYAVTADRQRGREALQWASLHPCETRQVTLILNWVGDLASDEQQRSLSQNCSPSSDRFTGLRDALFLSIAKNSDRPSPPKSFGPGIPEGRELYALVEYLDVIRTISHIDLRESDRKFFSDLPAAFLLSMRPQELDHPNWRAHIAALALVDLDPNLTASQFLQGWALEDRQMIQDGPAVAYEFLWANPYLPGISYENMQPWIYDGNGRLVCRSDWTEKACWITISTHVLEQNCPPEWPTQPAHFGFLTLIPMTEHCVELPDRPHSETIILWKIKPNGRVSYMEKREQQTRTADSAGMWSVPDQVHGKVCAAR